MKRLLLGLIGLLAVALVALLAWQAPEPGPEAALHGLASPPTGGDFFLRSQEGPVSLAQFRGKVVVLYFGYTWCPDICPTSLATLSAALDELSPQELAQVQALFVSVDPERDSLSRLKEYAAYFHPAILGVTGSREQLDRVTGEYGAAYRIQPDRGSATGYLVDHSADLYVIDRQGRLTATLPHGSTPGEIYTVLKRQLEGTL
ncbi:MAG TPA: SCO family protein [Sedimenticola sp.]|nr:SCO family protein [Sedimenticola sp.]